MQHIINTATGAFAISGIRDVTFNETKSSSFRGGDIAANLLKIYRMAGGKIVETHHALIKVQ
jgi:hypothetical protein